MIRALREFLCSVHLTITLFVLLAAGATLGTLVPQNIGAHEYFQIYGPFLARFLLVLDLTDVYHSIWFLGLIVLLAFNLMACSLYRFHRVWKAIHTAPRPLTDPLWRSLSVRRAFYGSTPLDSLVPLIRDTLKQGMWRVQETRKDGDIHFMAQKGGYGRLGAFVTHTGVIILLGGALLSFVLGFKGFVRISVNETVGAVQVRNQDTSRDLNFQIRCDDFHVSTYPDGTPKEYKSVLTFLQDGESVTQATLRVNHPFKFRGFVFYQASYGDSAIVTFEFASENGGKAHRVRLGLGETEKLNFANGIRIRPMRYDPNFQGRGPAVLLAVLKEGRHPVGGWLQKGETPVPLEGWTLRLIEAEGRPWTGLQVKKDPGAPVVWIGCILILLGCWAAFFIPHRKIWVRLYREHGETRCMVAASSSKEQLAVENRVDKLSLQWRNQGGLTESMEECHHG
jgi:cytochrome c biogenesis protein